MNNTNLKGTITEVQCQLYFLQNGFNVSVPLSPDRYDFLIDTGKEILKIQVKTANLNKVDGGLSFLTCSSHFINGTHVHTAYKDEIDFFCTYYNNQCFLVPVQECGSRQKTLRITPPKNGQIKGVCLAKDYIAEEVLRKR